MGSEGCCEWAALEDLHFFFITRIMWTKLKEGDFCIDVSSLRVNFNIDITLVIVFFYNSMFGGRL